MRPTPLPRISIPAILVGGGAVVLGFAPIGLRLSELGPQASAFWRFAFAVPVLAAALLILRARSPSAPQTGRLAIAGGFFALDIAFWHAALGFTSIANATLLSNMTPIFAAAASWLLLRERVGPRWAIGAAAALAGAGMLAVGRNGGEAGWFGDGLALISAAWYATYLLMLARLRASVDVVSAMLVTTLASVICAALFAALMNEPLWRADVSLQGWAILAGLGVVAHVGGQGLIAWGLGRLPVVLATVLLFLQPVSAALLGWWVFGESLTPLGALGACLVLVGVGVAQTARAKQVPAPLPADS